MLVQNKIVDAAKTIISSSLSANSITDWTIYGMMDTNSQTGIKFPCVRVACYDEEPLHKDVKSGYHKAELHLITTAIRITGSNPGEGTSASEFETVSDLVFNPFLANNIESTLSASTTNLIINQVIENGLETTPLLDGWIATQKLLVTCARTA